MSTVTTKRQFTPEDLLTMRDGDFYELIDGNLVEHDMGAISSLVGTRLIALIVLFWREHPTGWLWGGDCTYQCFPHAPNKVRRPDVSFIRAERLAANQIPPGHLRIAPDLAVEVVSPNDLHYETDQKLEDYQRAGVRVIWVINPQTRTVRVYRLDGSITGLREQDELSGEDVLTGFHCRVADLFLTPPVDNPTPSDDE
jgi:Uma2 family endonuclease